MRVCLTGGIACGKSLLSSFLRELGVEVVDADDLAHELIPNPEERRRIAAEVFGDPQKRKALEARMHPQILAKLEAFHREHPCTEKISVAVIPLLFELHWEGKYDIICSVISEKAVQVDRMMSGRGYSRAEAEARLAAQLPAEYKAEHSHYVVRNDTGPDALRLAAADMVRFLKEKMHERRT